MASNTHARKLCVFEDPGHVVVASVGENWREYTLSRAEYMYGVGISLSSGDLLDLFSCSGLANTDRGRPPPSSARFFVWVRKPCLLCGSMPNPRSHATVTRRGVCLRARTIHRLTNRSGHRRGGTAGFQLSVRAAHSVLEDRQFGERGACVAQRRKGGEGERGV